MDFALIMLLALGVTGFIWGVDQAFAVAKRRRLREQMRAHGASQVEIEHATKEPLLVEYARAFFPVILVVFLLRSFLVEPFRIPSGSMVPSLLIGDFILVNKYTYGIRLPVLNKKIAAVNLPKRGDIMVFRFPGDTSVNFIKRVVGLPGDHIVYTNKKLYVNGKVMEQTVIGSYLYNESGERRINALHLKEKLDNVGHDILISENTDQLPIEFDIPEGHYFVMGDNRDRSNDSRYWGTVPEQNIVGKAFLVWFSWDFANGGGILWNRMGNAIN